jgi:hypothetical protein
MVGIDEGILDWPSTPTITHFRGFTKGNRVIVTTRNATIHRGKIISVCTNNNALVIRADTGDISTPHTDIVSVKPA